MTPSRGLGPQLGGANLFLVRPDLDPTGEQSGLIDERDVGLVGVVVVVRGSARDGKSTATLASGDSFDRVRADLEYLIADGPVVATDISTVIDAGRAVELKAAHAANLSELLTQARNRFSHNPDAIARALGVSHQSRVTSADDVSQDSIALPITLVNSFIESLSTQLTFLEHLKEAQAASTNTHVTLETATGPLQYTLPLSLPDTYSSTEVSEILSPTGKGHRTIAQNRRRANELLGLKIGGRFRYPKFQIDPTKHEIRPVVAHANRRLESDADPWGTLDWWFSKDEGLDSSRPIDLLERNELSDALVDFAIERARQGMD